ncbi:MAG TPA: hypothetical protein VF777_05030 [Phycisphaerales bacterium]
MARGLPHLAVFTLMLCMLVPGCSTAPAPAAAPFPVAVIADADTGVYTLDFDPSLGTCPHFLPIRTRSSGKSVDGLFIPAGTAGSQQWIIKQSSENSGVGKLLIPLRAVWRDSRWEIVSGEVSVLYETVRRVASEPVEARVPTEASHQHPAPPPEIPGLMRPL